jgi:hypothetical protein
LDNWTVGQKGNGGGRNLDVVIFNTLGEKVFESKLIEEHNWRINIDLAGYQRGIYFISILQETALVETQKLIILK